MPKKTKEGETHYPVPGVYLVGVPHERHTNCTDDSHVESGAFRRYDKDEPASTASDVQPPATFEDIEQPSDSAEE